MDCVEALFWVTLPGDVSEHWEIGLVLAHCPLLHLPPSLESLMMRRATGPLVRAEFCWRTSAGPQLILLSLTWSHCGAPPPPWRGSTTHVK